MKMVISSKPYETKASDLKPSWKVMDADGKTLGRFASEIATMLTGKDKPIYVPHLLCGDYVIVINVDKIHVTGNKLQQKRYYRHSGYHGGLKERTLQQMMDKTPDRVMKAAVKGMLPKSALGRKMLARMKVYSGADHPHQAQVGASSE